MGLDGRRTGPEHIRRGIKTSKECAGLGVPPDVPSVEPLHCVGLFSLGTYMHVCIMQHVGIEIEGISSRLYDERLTARETDYDVLDVWFDVRGTGLGRIRRASRYHMMA